MMLLRAPLLAASLISAKQFDDATQSTQPCLPFLLDRYALNDDAVATACAHYYRSRCINRADLQNIDSTHAHAKHALLDNHTYLLYRTSTHALRLFIAHPDALHLVGFLQFSYNQPVTVAFVPFHALLALTKKRDTSRTSDSPTKQTDPTQWLETLLLQAIETNASDIHIEPQQHQTNIRFRLDGLLQPIEAISHTLSLAVISSIKIKAKCNIADTRLPQDGHFSIKEHAADKFDCRVSTCPSQYGEKVVLRLLESNKRLYSVHELGMSTAAQRVFEQAVTKPSGLILVAGPTGSGKTVTLYTALKLLNTTTRNIHTIEDPIEIQLPGITQVTVNEKIELTFARALRAFLRQDPDVIMVGEIRDKETARIALRAAQTGHLVLSTIHTNHAVETLYRLQNLGLPLDQLRASLSLIVAQRLVRKVCSTCLGTAHKNNTPCPHCHGGYKGRTGIYELLPFHDKTAAFDITSAKQHLCGTLLDSANRLCQKGLTTQAEINRVLSEHAPG